VDVLNSDLHCQVFGEQLGSQSRLHIFENFLLDPLDGSFGEHADRATNQPVNVRYFRVRCFDLGVVQLRSHVAGELLSDPADEFTRGDPDDLSGLS